MTTVKYIKESGAKKGVRKTSLEAESPTPSSVEAASLRRVRSDSLTPNIHTFTPKFLKDEKNCSPNIKMKFDLHDSTQLLGGDLAKARTKKHSGKQHHRRSSVQKGVTLDVVALHKLKKRQEEEDGESIYSSDLSIKASPSLDHCQHRKHKEPSRLSPSLTITYSPDDDDDDQRNFDDESDTSSVYHSSCLYQPEEGQKVTGNLEDPRKTLEHKRRMSSPIVNDRNRQQKVAVAGTRVNSAVEFPDGDRRHSSQDGPNLLSFEPATLSSKGKCYSTQDDLTTAPALLKSNQSLPARLDMSTTPTKESRGSADGQTQPRTRKEAAKDPPDQNCQSNFGIMLSAICFLLFLWYLVMACSKFIKSAHPFEAFDQMPLPDLVIQEVVVHIAVEEPLEAADK